MGKIAAHSAYDIVSWYKCLIVSLVFSHLWFWSGNLFLIAPFPDLCLLVPYYELAPVFTILMYLHFQSLVNVNLDLMVYGKGVMTNVNGALH